MRTEFSDAQLSDPRIAEANAILRSCVHCGFCAPACPTYAVTGNELESPRGRIWLIRDLLEGDGAPDTDTVAHLDHCLECVACMPACPSGVDYRHLIAIAREDIAAHAPRPAADRVLRHFLAAVLTRPRRAGRLFRLARLLAFLAPIMPGRLRAALRLAVGTAPAQRTGPRSGIYPPEGTWRGRVGILAGCVQSVLAPVINRSLVRIFARVGIETVVIEDAYCCGAIDHHLGRLAATRDHARDVITAVEDSRADAGLFALVQTAAGCGTMMKDYGHLLAGDPDWAGRAEAVSALTQDASECLAALDLPFLDDLPRLKVAWQVPCSLANAQGITHEPVALLERAGFEVVTPSESYCCGSAGTYNVLEPEMSDALGTRKADALNALGADVVVSANIGCMTQLAPRLDVPVVHLVELLDWATGGERPAALQGVRSGGLDRAPV